MRTLWDLLARWLWVRRLERDNRRLRRLHLHLRWARNHGQCEKEQRLDVEIQRLRARMGA